jgi:hypothetical protein
MSPILLFSSKLQRKGLLVNLVRVRLALVSSVSPNRTKLEPLGRGHEGFIVNYLIGQSLVWGLYSSDRHNENSGSYEHGQIIQGEGYI